MTEQHDEKLSAFFDDEQAGSAELLNAAMTEAMQARWSRYQMIRDVCQGQRPEPTDMVARVRAAIADEPTVLAPPVASPKAAPQAPKSAAVIGLGWRQQLTGLAVAASVAVVTIVGVQQLQTPTPGVATPLVADVELPAVAPSIAPAEIVPVAARPLSEQKVNEYMMNHAEFATTGGAKGMLPYVRIVGYKAEMEQ